MKKVFSFVFGLLFMGSLFAQNPMMQPLPFDPAVRVGKLDNGLTYYIRHNEHPKNQANFYIAQKVGSINEEDNQRGLAHFLEHMCFNGTKHFPGNSLITYLEGIGVRFGEQLNAYTSIEETVYNIDNVPTQRETALDSALLILADWSHDLLLNDSDINDERGVIHEEWRMRMVGMLRLYEEAFPKLMGGCRFGYRLPIGILSVVDSFPCQVIKDYYHKWYRPDLQGIVVVGDFDADKMEEKVKTLFGAIPAPVNPAKREYLGVPDNDEAIVFSGKDKELTTNVISIMQKHPAMPDSVKNTLVGVLEHYLRAITSSVINNRFAELSLKPECPFVGAQAEDGSFLFSHKVTGSFNVDFVPKEGRTAEAVQAVMAEIYRVKDFGLTKGEIDRAVLDFTSNVEQEYNNRDQRKSAQFCHEYYRSFLDNEACPGIETEYMLLQQITPALPTESYNQYIQELISRNDSNLVIFSAFADKEGAQIPTEEELLGAVHAAQQMPLEAWVDNVKTGPLLESVPTPGTIKSEKKGPYGSTVLTLSNGVTVIMQKTDFKEDEILLDAWSKGGWAKYGEAEKFNASAINDVMGVSGLGGFTQVELHKALAGKNASVSAYVGSSEEGLNGNTTIKDQRTLFELIYLHFQPRLRDDAAFESWRTRAIELLRNKYLSPQSILSDSLKATVFDHHWETAIADTNDIKNIDYARVMDMYADRFADASDFTFLFVGSINEDSIRNLACQYLATLPVVKRADKVVDTKRHFHKGPLTNEFSVKMQEPAVTMVDIWNGDFKPTVKNDVVLDILSQNLDQRYLHKIREEMGAAYATQVSGQWNFNDANGKVFYNLFAYFPIKPETKDSVCLVAHEIFTDIALNGISDEDLTKGKEYLIKSFRQAQRENGAMKRNIATMVAYKFDATKNYEAIVQSITSADVQKMAQKIIKDNNIVHIIMLPEEK